MRKAIFVLMALVLALAIPATALAAGPFTDIHSSGVITGITPGEVFPAGNSGRWVVADRQVTGELTGNLAGEYILTYHANIESLATQAGQFSGSIVIGDGLTASVRGTLEPVEFYGWYAADVPLFKLSFEGTWTFTKGTAQGNGSFSGYAVFVPTLEGHVGYIVASGFSMDGKWKQ